jgi:hypothetical protein
VPDSITSPFAIKFTLYKEGLFGGIGYEKTLYYSGQKARFIDDSALFPDLKTGFAFIGILKIESKENIYLEVMRMDITADGFLYTSTPPDYHTP